MVRDELLEKHPGLAADIFSAFADAKNIYVKRLRHMDNPTGADLTYKRVMELIGDPLPYGVEPNRAMIDKLIDHAVRQRILDQPPALESLFHPGALELTA